MVGVSEERWKQCPTEKMDSGGHGTVDIVSEHDISKRLVSVRVYFQHWLERSRQARLPCVEVVV